VYWSRWFVWGQEPQIVPANQLPVQPHMVGIVSESMSPPGQRDRFPYWTNNLSRAGDLHTMSHRLPTFVKPTHYDVTLYNFNFQEFTYSGRVIIRWLFRLHFAHCSVWWSSRGCKTQSFWILTVLSSAKRPLKVSVRALFLPRHCEFAMMKGDELSHWNSEIQFAIQIGRVGCQFSSMESCQTPWRGFIEAVIPLTKGKICTCSQRNAR